MLYQADDIQNHLHQLVPCVQKDSLRPVPSTRAAIPRFQSSYKEVVVCFIFESRDNLLAVCFLSYFPPWEIVQKDTDNCSLYAGRNDA
jgi:hypothetical protein